MEAGAGTSTHECTRWKNQIIVSLHPIEGCRHTCLVHSPSDDGDDTNHETENAAADPKEAVSEGMQVCKQISPLHVC